MSGFWGISACCIRTDGASGPVNTKFEAKCTPWGSLSGALAVGMLIKGKINFEQREILILKGAGIGSVGEQGLAPWSKRCSRTDDPFDIYFNETGPVQSKTAT